MSINKLFDLTGKTALVTGGGQGIGKAIVLALAENGANVVINYRSNQSLAEQTACEAAQYGKKIWLWPFDLESEQVLEAYRDFVEANNCHADILVANASVQIRKKWDEITNDEFAQQVNINLRATLQLIQGVVPHMRQCGWGRILNIGSVQQVRPHESMCVYAATKSALVNLVKNLAPQLAPFGINVNNLAPGVIATARTAGVLANPAYTKKVSESMIPVGYIGKPNDCAALALLLCSDASRYITGVDYLVDGGLGLCF